MLNSVVETPTVYQDNTSVIALVTVGSGKVRTIKMRAHIPLVMEAITEKRIVVKYVHLLGMIANGFNKTLVGSDFDSFVDQVLGTNKSTSGR